MRGQNTTTLSKMPEKAARKDLGMNKDKKFIKVFNYIPPACLGQLEELCLEFPAIESLAEEFSGLRKKLDVAEAPESMCADISPEFEKLRVSSTPTDTSGEGGNSKGSDSTQLLTEFNKFITEMKRIEANQNHQLEGPSFRVYLEQLISAKDIESLYENSQKLVEYLDDDIEYIKNFYASNDEIKWKVTGEQALEVFGLVGVLKEPEITTAKNIFKKAQWNLLKAHAFIFRLREIIKDFNARCQPNTEEAQS
ncbi:hypothetical protein BS50DRAFT_621453 [Corynespora cassiicola Philippines]|uniref:Uncharacterized protein n=1 Tax=Corynespora cassiicola Philippines TaxID=1448308 RepID=A0A2T2NPW3_CORCC|nr:hypothetical protein BS50DRAFT_621453 [Corynespora cassiicola Philippines]